MEQLAISVLKNKEKQENQVNVAMWPEEKKA
jgi:hypothetical protein